MWPSLTAVLAHRARIGECRGGQSRWAPGIWSWVVVSAVAGSALAPGNLRAEDSSRRIRVAFSSTVDFGDLPALMAHTLLAAEGYEVVPTSFASAQLAADALARGQADVGHGSTRTYWAAIAKGASIATVMEQVGNGWALVSTSEIHTCADLDARRLAITGEGSVSAVISRAYLRSRCPGVEPRIVTIGGSENRAAALLAGRVDAAPLELAESLYLAALAPGRFRTLLRFADDLPWLVTTAVHVNRRWAERNSRAVRDYLKALLTTHRQVAHQPDLVAAEARARLRFEPTLVTDVANAYLRTNAWDVNGRLTAAVVRDSLAFFVRSASLPDSLTAEHVADLSYLEQVLGELGRR